MQSDHQKWDLPSERDQVAFYNALVKQIVLLSPEELQVLINKPRRAGYALLHEAIHNGDIPFIELLLACGADPNVPNNSIDSGYYGYTPLHTAVLTINLRGTERTVTKKGYEIEQKRKKVYELLLSYGADPTLVPSEVMQMDELEKKQIVEAECRPDQLKGNGSLLLNAVKTLEQLEVIEQLQGKDKKLQKSKKADIIEKIKFDQAEKRKHPEGKESLLSRIGKILEEIEKRKKEKKTAKMEVILDNVKQEDQQKNEQNKVASKQENKSKYGYFNLSFLSFLTVKKDSFEWRYKELKKNMKNYDKLYEKYMNKSLEESSDKQKAAIEKIKTALEGRHQKISALWELLLTERDVAKANKVEQKREAVTYTKNQHKSIKQNGQPSDREQEKP